MKSKQVKRMGSESGMTLMEVIVAMAMMSIVVIAFLSLFSASMYFSIRAGDRTENATDAAGVVENALAGTTIVDGAGTIIVDGTVIPDSDYDRQTVDVEVRFKGTSTKQSVECRKIVVQLEGETVKGSSTESEVEVFVCD